MLGIRLNHVTTGAVIFYQIAKFMGPTWANLGPVGPRWVGPMLVSWTLISGWSVLSRVSRIPIPSERTTIKSHLFPFTSFRETIPIITILQVYSKLNLGIWLNGFEYFMNRSSTITMRVCIRYCIRCRLIFPHIGWFAVSICVAVTHIYLLSMLTYWQWKPLEQM